MKSALADYTQYTMWSYYNSCNLMQLAAFIAYLSLSRKSLASVLL